MNNKKFVRPTDIIIIATILLISILFSIIYPRVTQTNNPVALISINGSPTYELSLEKDTSFSLENHPYITIEIKNGKARFLSSNCNDQVCVNTGYIYRTDEFSACLPNGVVLQIVDGNNSDTDIITN